MDRIPRDILFYMFEFLSFFSLLRLGYTCRGLRDLMRKRDSVSKRMAATEAVIARYLWTVH